MQKELEPIQQLIERRERTSAILVEGNALVGRLNTRVEEKDRDRHGSPEDPFQATLDFGYANKARNTVKRVVDGLTDRLGNIDKDIEPHAIEIAKAHLSKVELRRTQLAVMSEMVAEGNLTPDDLHKHQQDFEELVKRPETNPLLQKGLDKIRQEEEAKGKEGEPKPPEVVVLPKAEPPKTEEAKPLIEVLPDGKVRLPNGKEVKGKPAELLSFLSDSSEENQKTTDQVGKEVYPEANDRTAANSAARSCIARTKKGLIGTGIELVSIIPDNVSKKHGEKAGHFLKEEQATQAVEQELPEKPEATTVETPEIISLSKVDAFIQELPDETRALFAEVRDSTDFGYARDIVRSFVGTNPEDIKELGRRVDGYLFETFAYLHLRKKFSMQNQILLSPQETFEIYYQLHPTRREQSDEYKLQRGIDGISVPDGILLTRLKNGNRGVRVDGVLEYKLGIHNDLETADKLARDPSRFLESMSPLKDTRSPESNIIRQYLLSRYSDFPRNILVNPNVEEFLAVPLDAKMPSIPVAGVKKISIPVSSVTFGHFVNALMSEIKDNKTSEPESPTEPGMFRLPDGRLVHLSEKEQKYLSLIPTEMDAAIPNSELVKKIYVDEFERGEITLQKALWRANACRYTLNANKLNPAGWEVRNTGLIDRKRGIKRVEAKLHLVPIQEKEQPEEPEETPPETPPTTEIGETPSPQPPEQAGGGKNIEVLPLARQVEETFRSIVRTIPLSLRKDIVELLVGRKDIAREELANVARMVVAYREGEIALPNPSDFLNARRDEEKQLEYAKITVRGILAQSILREGSFQQSSQGLKARIGRATNELSFFLGQKNGKQIVAEALSELSVTERTLLFKSMSTNLKKNLGFPDIDECDEIQMASYLEVVTYEPNVKRREEVGMRRESRMELTQILDACMERVDRGFNVRKILDQLSENDDKEIIFSTMIDACETESALDLLESFFQQHEETHKFARECRIRRQREQDFFDYDE